MLANDDVVNVALPRDQWQSVLQTISKRQQDCRKVTPEFRTHKVYADLDVQYEKLKMAIANQLPVAK